MTEYKVALDVYSGPLDLLLFFIRRDEIDIYDIPIATITGQYIEYVELLKVLDPDSIGDFLVLAATLIEIKSRTLLPKPPPEEAETEDVDPRLELVRQLLEYKKYKDAARSLEASAVERSLRHERRPAVLDAPADEVELENTGIWELFDAFKRVLEQTGEIGEVHRVGIDDTPMALHAEDIIDSLQRAGGSQMFEEIFAGRTRPEMIGLFLALLELIRQQRVGARQERTLGPIHLYLREPVDLADDDELSPSVGETPGAPEGSTGTLALPEESKRAAEPKEAVADLKEAT